MPTVIFRDVWLNDGAFPGDKIRVDATVGNSHDMTLNVDGSTEKLAGGRYRSVIEEGQQDVWALSIEKASTEARLWIEKHIGRPVYVRDRFGARLYGTYRSVSRKTNPYIPQMDMSFTVEQETEPVI